MKALSLLATLVFTSLAQAACPIYSNAGGAFRSVKFDACHRATHERCVFAVTSDGEVIVDALKVTSCGRGNFNCIYEGQVFTVDKYAIDEIGNSAADIRVRGSATLIATCR